MCLLFSIDLLVCLSACLLVYRSTRMVAVSSCLPLIQGRVIKQWTSICVFIVSHVLHKVAGLFADPLTHLPFASS